MLTHKKVIIKDTAPYELADKQRQLTRRLERNHDETTTRQEIIVELETRLEHLAHDNQLPIKDSSILSEIQDQLTRVVNKIQDKTQEINWLKESSKELEDQLSRLQYQININVPRTTRVAEFPLEPCGALAHVVVAVVFILVAHAVAVANNARVSPRAVLVRGRDPGDVVDRERKLVLPRPPLLHVGAGFESGMADADRVPTLGGVAERRGDMFLPLLFRRAPRVHTHQH